MKIGLGVPQIGDLADPAKTREVAIAAEDLGYASLWALDRMLAPVAPRSPYPASADGSLPLEQRRVLDPLITLTVAAAVTERIALGTNVLVAPWYAPIVLARSLASLDVVSGGRLRVGLGLGWSVDEYAAVGVPKQHLGARLEEVLDVLTVAWGDDVVAIETSRESIAPSTFEPKPVQRPRPPVLLAAYTPAGLERVARRADGWTPAGLPLEVVRTMWGEVIAMAERHGRDAERMRLVVRANVKVVPGLADEDRPVFVGSLDQIRRDVDRASVIGADELVLDLQGTVGSVAEMLDLAALLSDDVAARVA
jgi:probable F420-dependent oxidoreductase